MKNNLDKIKKESINDSQIDNSFIFENFTDFQNVMLCDLSLVELLWEGNETELKNITIEQLYIKNFIKTNKNVEYDKIIFTENEMLEITKKKNRKKYRNLVLGKLIRFGFSNIKIIEKISGKNGFDAFILEDSNKDIMVYYPCTNIIELEDYLYDSYPIIESLSKKTAIISNIIQIKKIYNSQQKQAKEIIENIINKLNNKNKIYISGFSLGGSLAECAYLNINKKYGKKIQKIILFNPYHNRLSKEEINALKKNNKLKLYVCEGDLVSTVFNYDEFLDIAKIIYIDYHKNISNSINDIENNKGILNDVANTIKNNYLNNIIISLKKIRKKHFLNLPTHVLIDSVIKKIYKFKKNNIRTTEIINQINEFIEKKAKKLEKHGHNIFKDNDFSFIKNLKYIEIIFTSTHLTYTVNQNKLISFDEKGNVKNKINIKNKKYKLSYPSFDEVSIELFGSNPYKDLSNLIKNKK